VIELIRTLPEGERVCGVTTLDGKIYVLRWRGKEHVEEYDSVTFTVERCLDVPDLRLRGFTDMTVCAHNRCLYIGDDIGECVHRVELNGECTKWPVRDKPASLSVNASHNVLVSCKALHKVKEFSSHGDLLQDIGIGEITLPDEVTNPWHSMQLPSSGELIVCHGEVGDVTNRVCKITADGRDIVQSNGGPPGSGTDQFKVPRHVAIDYDNEFVFVADQDNRRVKLLSPTLTRLYDAVSRDHFKWGPTALCLDAVNQRLYVSDSEIKEDEPASTGRVLVFNMYKDY